jgi:UDP-GlcNAc:undecaprenyl-phosphate GlcNAc-1-phosphate transferase
MTPSPALAGLVALVTAVCLTPLAGRLAVRAGLVAVPHADRWHRREIPLLGGLALVVATLAGVVVGGPVARTVLVLLLCATAVGAVGLYDDARSLRPQTKLILQILIASVLTAVGLQFQGTGIAPVDMLITLVWMVGITNAFNLLDNMDGLAAGTAAIVAGFRLAFFLADGNAEGAMLSAVILGASVGFLVYNFQPASIFMGDAGSLFLGFMVAGLSLVGGGFSYSRGTALVLVLPVLVLLVPIFDTTFVTISRVLAGRPVSQGGRDHTSHRLVALGMSERQAVLILYALACAGGGIAWFSYRYGLSYGAVLAVLLVLGTILFGVFLGRLQEYPSGGTRPGAVATMLADFSYKQQVAAVAVDTLLIVAAYYSAYVLRFEGQLHLAQATFRQSLPIVVVAQVAAFFMAEIHRGVWRHTGMSDLLRVGRACLVGSVLAVLGVLFLYRFEGYSRAVFVLYCLLLFIFVAASRTSFRALDEFVRARQNPGHPVLIYGAGHGGVMVLREVSSNADLGWRVVAFADDDPDKRGTRLQGIPVAGGIDHLETTLDTFGPEVVIISSSKIDPSVVDRVRTRCSVSGIAVVSASVKFE